MTSCASRRVLSDAQLDVRVMDAVEGAAATIAEYTGQPLIDTVYTVDVAPTLHYADLGKIKYPKSVESVTYWTADDSDAPKPKPTNSIPVAASRVVRAAVHPCRPEHRQGARVLVATTGYGVAVGSRSLACRSADGNESCRAPADTAGNRIAGAAVVRWAYATAQQHAAQLAGVVG